MADLTFSDDSVWAPALQYLLFCVPNEGHDGIGLKQKLPMNGNLH